MLDVRPIPLLVTVVAQGLLLVAVEIGFRKGLGPETTRRIAHAVGAASVAILPLFLRLSELVVLAVFFTAVLAWTRARNALGSIHAIDRGSVGALVFPAGLLLAILVGWHHPGAIAYAALVLGLADPIAALAGSRLESFGWAVVGGRKTLAGSLAFALVAVAIGVLMSIGAGDLRLFAAVAAAVVLTAVEGSVGYGLDNLPVPVVASLVAIAWLGL